MCWVMFRWDWIGEMLIVIYLGSWLEFFKQILILQIVFHSFRSTCSVKDEETMLKYFQLNWI